jgi:hypothetical protein
MTEWVVVNMYEQKRSNGTNNVRDAEWIADLLRHGLFKGSYKKPSAKAPVIDPGDEAPFLLGR